MKNASASKSKDVKSPKTPGGISKSLLTPCRRLGLSRKWRRSGSSPFISPLASSSEREQEKFENRKRKEPDLGDECVKTPESSALTEENNDTVIIDINTKNTTPCRNVDLPRRKKSKSLLSAINTTQFITGSESPTNSISLHKNATDKTKKDTCENIITEKTDISTPTKCTKDIISPKSGHKKQNLRNVEQLPHEEAKAIVNDNKNLDKKEDDRIDCKKKEHKPNDLKKECMVVIQKKIFKTELIDNQMHCNAEHKEIINNETTTQTLFDSDSDDEPLNNLSLKRLDPSQSDKDDCERKCMKKTSEKTSQKSKNISKNLKNPKVISKPKSIDTDTDELSDDDFIEPKKTILIRKTYAKVTKPSKAKSTGSITQRDIDELKARIEVKKKLLLAQAMTEDTRELRDLIKKWQKGCQDALMELMDLMKTKFPDKSNMDYSEILETLKIPPTLVGYDADEDCFNTPDDANIILATLNDA